MSKKRNVKKKRKEKQTNISLGFVGRIRAAEWIFNAVFVVEGRNLGRIFKGRSSESGRTDLTDGTEDEEYRWSRLYGRFEAVIWVSTPIVVTALWSDRFLQSRLKLWSAEAAAALLFFLLRFFFFLLSFCLRKRQMWCWDGGISVVFLSRKSFSPQSDGSQSEHLEKAANDERAASEETRRLRTARIWKWALKSKRQFN